MSDDNLYNDDLYGDLYSGQEAPSASLPSKPAASASIYSMRDDAVVTRATEDPRPSSYQRPPVPNQAPPSPVPVRDERPAAPHVPPAGGRADIPVAGRIEDGKMFIGGLNWETNDEKLQDYFEQFGEVASCTVMRDANTGRSRGFAFLTFKDPASVNDVMVREHFLDGKNIDPKRAIPKKDDNRTDKLFVRNIPQGVTQPMFQDFFAKFGVIADCTLMMDAASNTHRGFGFVTYKSEETVDQVVRNQPYAFLGQQIEVRKSAPRARDDYGGGGRGRGRGPPGGHSNAWEGNAGGSGGGYGNNAMMGQGFDPNAMAEYFKNMGWGAMNPMMMMNPMMFGMAGNMGDQMGQWGNAWGGMGGMQSQQQGSGGGINAFGQPRQSGPPPGAPTGPRGGGSGGDSSGPVRHNARGNANYHPYSR